MPTPQLQKVLIVGAGGTNIGHHIANALSKDSSFELSIISRAGSKSTYPSNAKVITIPGNPTHDDYVQALQGQDAVVSGLGFEGKPTEKALIDAAVEAGVKRFLPSEYGVDNTNPAASELSPVFKRKADILEYLKSKQATGLSWTAVPTGMWLDWYAFAIYHFFALVELTLFVCLTRALDPSIAFIGIDIHAHTAELWAQGTYKMTFTTLPTAADAVRRILLNPEATQNRVVPVRNFEASLNEIVALLEEAQGVKYKLTPVEDTDETIGLKQKEWVESGERDVGAALWLVKAGFLLPGYGSNFAESGRWKLGNEIVGFDAGSVGLRDVVGDVVERFS
jgi:uncharacterized protein YbjT (DUF2867 family)